MLTPKTRTVSATVGSNPNTLWEELATGLLKSLIMTHSSSSAVAVTLQHTHNSVTATLLNALEIPPDGVLQWDCQMVLENGDELTLTVADTVTVHLTWAEEA